MSILYNYLRRYFVINYMGQELYYAAKVVSNDIWEKCIDSILICCKCEKKLQKIDPYLYNWRDVIMKYGNSE